MKPIVRSVLNALSSCVWASPALSSLCRMSTMFRLHRTQKLAQRFHCGPIVYQDHTRARASVPI